MSRLLLAGMISAIAGAPAAADSPVLPAPAPVEQTAPEPAGFEQVGAASFYADRFQGRRTANGETYDGDEMTAAHPDLPFGSLLEVTNLENGRSVLVRVNDRGPYHGRRVIDLSKAAAQTLDFLKRGTAKVRIRALKAAAAPAPAALTEPSVDSPDPSPPFLPTGAGV